MKRIAIIGTSGSGKTTLAKKLSKCLKIQSYELDNLYWLPNWQHNDLDLFREKVKSITNNKHWIICGNYSKLRDITLEKADTIIWLDFSIMLVLYRNLIRCFKRVFSKCTICNGNYETISRTFFSKDSILLWALTTHWKHKKTYPRLFKNKEYSKKTTLRFKSAVALNRWFNSLF